MGFPVGKHLAEEPDVLGWHTAILHVVKKLLFDHVGEHCLDV